MVELIADRWAEGRALLRAADPRMAALVDARPDLDPDAFFDTWPSELWSALVAQVIGQQISLVAAAAIRGRLEALCGGASPTPEQLLAFDAARRRAVARQDGLSARPRRTTGRRAARSRPAARP
jgi:3-methyladenine DNA glycosylase/8-oxoguanine DNA glycosylase